MKTLPREQADALFDKFWDEMESEWFKIEVLQDYSAEDDSPSLRSWIGGDRAESIRLLRAEADPEWINQCQAKLKQGVKLVRVHLVEEPFTPYLQWELEHYKYVNVPRCGERVHLVNKSELIGLEIPPGDIIIFDKIRAVVNDYDARGLMTRQTFYDKNDDINNFLELRKQLIKLAKPLPAKT
jgi:hypothetical protein